MHDAKLALQAVDTGTLGVLGHSYLSAARCMSHHRLVYFGNSESGPDWWCLTPASVACTLSPPPTLLLGISTGAAICFVFIHRLFLLILSDHSGFLFRQLSISVWILLPLVIFHVSEPAVLILYWCWTFFFVFHCFYLSGALYVTELEEGYPCLFLRVFCVPPCL